MCNPFRCFTPLNTEYKRRRNVNSGQLGSIFGICQAGLMDTMLILHTTLLLVVAVVPSYSDNETVPVGFSITTTASPITITTVKIIDAKNVLDDDLSFEKSKRRLRIGSPLFEDTLTSNRRHEPSSSNSQTSLNEPGFDGGKSDLRSSFNIDDVHVKSNPSLDINRPVIKSRSTFSVEDPSTKETSFFDMENPTFSLDGASFIIDGGVFNLDGPFFDVGGMGVKGNPLFGIDAADFDFRPNIKSKSSFEKDFQNPIRSSLHNAEPVVNGSPLYNSESPNAKNHLHESESHKSEVSIPEASSIRSTSSIGPTYDSVSKQNYNHPKSQSYITPQNSYLKHSSTPPGPAYSNTKIQNVGNQANSNSQVYNSYGTTPYYENFFATTSSESITDQPKALSNIKSAYSNPSEPSTDKNIQGYFQGQNSFKNNAFNDHGAFGEYPAFQNFNHDFFLQTGNVGPSQYLGSQATQTPIYNSQYPGPKNSQQVHSPSHQTVISFSPSTQSFEKSTQNIAYTSSPLEYKKRASSLPVIQIQNSQEYPRFIQALETEPVVLSTGNNINFQSNPNFGLSFGFGKGRENQPFLATTNNFQQQQQVQPVQSSSSTPQFPQYKGASIITHPRIDYGKQPGIYQPLVNQPQLHFNANAQAIHRPQFFAAPKSSERIREDVEIIKTKKPQAPPKNDDNEEEEEDEEEDEDEEVDEDDDDDNDDELDEGCKSSRQQYGQSDEDESSEPDSGEFSFSENYSEEEPESKSSMSPMPPFVFQPYDGKVGRLHEFAHQPELQNHFSDEASLEDEEEYSPKTYPVTKLPFVGYDQKSTKPYFSYLPLKQSKTANDENEEKTKIYKKQEDDSDNRNSQFKGLKVLRDYEQRYKKKSDVPHKTEPLENKHAYVTHVPDINQLSVENRTILPIISKYSREKNFTPKPIYRGYYGTGGSTERSIRTGTKKPINRTYKNSDEQETIINSKTDPKVIYEESFGYKIPKNEENTGKFFGNRKAPTENSHSGFINYNDGGERNLKVKKVPTENSYLQGRRGSYKSDSPKKGDTALYENGDPYSYSSGRNWKSNKKSPEATDFYSGPSQKVRNVADITEDNHSSFSPERIRPGSSGSIFRDFTDIH